LGINVTVSALDYESARRIVTEPVRGRLVYSKEALDRVVHLTAQHPYLIQLLCNAIFEYAAQTKSRSITLGVVNDVAGSLARSNEHFTDLWVYAGLGPGLGRKRRQLMLLLFARALKQDVRIRFSSLREQLAQSGVEAGDEALAADLAYLRELELIQLSGEIGDGQYSLTVPLMAEWIEQQHDADVVISRARTEAEEEHD
jgi:type I restriction enzyme M protein